MPGERCLRLREELRRLDPLLVAPSRWLAGMARSVLPDLRTTVVPNGVPWTAERPGERGQARKRLGIHARAAVILFAAHGGKEALLKGGAHWEPIWARIKEQLPEAVGLFVGGNRSGRQGDLLLLPFADRRSMDLVLEASSLLVYPTLADNHPLVVLEAMARGTCVAAFEVGGLGEQIRSGSTGLLVPPGQWRTLADRAAEALRTGRAAGMARTAWEHGRDRFSVERMVRDYLRIYNGMVE